MGQQKKERKLTGPNTLPAVGRTKGLSKSREASLQRMAQPRRRQEAGGGERGRLGPRTVAPTALQTGLQFLTKDLLRFWMVDIHWEGHGETQGAGTRPARAGTGAGAAEGRRRAAPGESAPVKLLAA